jgi:hypothetical protein
MSNLISRIKGRTQGAGNNCILRNGVRGSESGDYEEFCRLGYDAMLSGTSPMFQMTVLPPSSGYNRRPSKQPAGSEEHIQSIDTFLRDACEVLPDCTALQLHNEELHDLYSSWNDIRVMISRM